VYGRRLLATSLFFCSFITSADFTGVEYTMVVGQATFDSKTPGSFDPGRFNVFGFVA